MDFIDQKMPVFLTQQGLWVFQQALPTAEEILALRPSDTLQQQIDTLLQKNKTQGLSSEEERLWQQYEYIEHLVRVAKSKATIKLNAATDSQNTCG